ncbi:hypothetical protein WA158_008156 [Blastocystis sp. Blastoise]
MEKHTTSYTARRVVGNGSFGVVYQAVVADTNEIVAIKKVLQDKRFKNRELYILKKMDHPNVVRLLNSFYSDKQNGELYLNLVMDYIPDTLYRCSRRYIKVNTLMPMIYVKLYAYQLFKALNYVHSLGFCHRDIKPQNLLIQIETHILKLCDFGSAKKLVKGEPNVSYICSRYYRAPELIFGSTEYTVAIDIWSAGCVLAELLIGKPLFPGESNVDQLVEIIKVLGTPTSEQIKEMNPSYQNFRFPSIITKHWEDVLSIRPDPLCIDLINKILIFEPTKRLTALEVMAHPFFDDLRAGCLLPGGTPLPDTLFDFTDTELASNPSLLDKLLPKKQE